MKSIVVNSRYWLSWWLLLFHKFCCKIIAGMCMVGCKNTVQFQTPCSSESFYGWWQVLNYLLKTVTGFHCFVISLSLSLSLSSSFVFSSTHCCWVVAKSCQLLEPMDCGPPDSPIHGISLPHTPQKKPGLGKEHMGRDLWRHRDGKAHQEGMSVRNIRVYSRSGQEPQLPGLAMNTAQHPFSLPSVCSAPLFSGVLGSRLWYLLGSRHSCLFVGLCEVWNALNDSLQHWKAGPRAWG